MGGEQGRGPHRGKTGAIAPPHPRTVARGSTPRRGPGAFRALWKENIMKKFDLLSAISLLSRFGSAAGKGAMVGAVGGAVVELAAPAAVNALLLRAIRKGGCTPSTKQTVEGRITVVDAMTRGGHPVTVTVLPSGYVVDGDAGALTAPSLSALTSLLGGFN